MDKCRICLKYRKNLRSLNDQTEGITFLDMITSLTDIKMYSENNIPDQICSSCRKRLIEAYKFKVDIELSDKILNETANLRRITFNNINDIKFQINLDFKPVIPSIHPFTEDILKYEETLTYNDIIVKKILKQRPQLTVNEFLNSVKMESYDDCNDQNYDYKTEHDVSNDSDYDYNRPSKHKKIYSKSNKIKDKNESNRNKDINLPIKPIYLNDIKIEHSEVPRKITDQPKRKYKYPPKTTVCPFCGKLFGSKYVDIHILHHTSKKSYKCEVCSKIFITEQLLNYHKKKHEDRKKINCSQCIATFTCSGLLQRHKLVHSEVKNHICDICSKAFKRKSALRRHILIHNFGKKSIQCELCPMTFHSKDFLRHHMRVHTGERPYRCEICSQPYSYKHDFNRHCLKKHGVFLKRRSINIMTEEVLQQERALMRDLALRAHGVIKGDIPKEFEGPQGAMAYEQAIKAIEARQIPITCTDTTYRL